MSLFSSEQNQLATIEEAVQEPVGMWLPEGLRPVGTSEYVQGVEVSDDYDGDVLTGFEVLELPACKMMVFQGPPRPPALSTASQKLVNNVWSLAPSASSLANHMTRPCSFLVPGPRLEVLRH